MSREPLVARRLQQELAGGLWRSIEVVPETGSTNADLAAAARSGAPEGMVLAAEYQRAGRGRAGRRWTSPPGAGLAVSVLLRPGLPAAGWPPAPATWWGWLPLLAGLALAESVAEQAAVPARLKWPNDLLAGGGPAPGKAAGVLAEVVDDAVVIGVGLNVTVRADELPSPPPAAPRPTSLVLVGSATADRERLLVALLRRLADWYDRWRQAAGDADQCGLRAAYQRVCDTLGRPVRVGLPAGGELTGYAQDVDPAGRLVLRTGGQVRALAAGDVSHLRRVTHPAECEG